jgi:muramidase (phage lysozyme)
MSDNLIAFLDMIAYSELGPKIIAESDNGYDVLVGSLPGNVKRFGTYADHPRVLVKVRIKSPKTGKVMVVESTAAGRYQILEWIFDAYKKRLKLPDFSPLAQDAIARQLIRECRALADIDAGRFDIAARKCASRWASLPGAGYEQHENKLDDLRTAYVSAGGKLA